MAGIYIHIPFCKQKCTYCDFHFAVSLRNKDALLQALKKEIEIRKDESNESIETVYFGGGTPSVLSVYELTDLLQTIFENYKLTEDPEITLEANPDDLTKTYLKDLYNTPINRLSIGTQSFYDDDLRFMNRAHTAEEALNSIRFAKQVGFENISIDLIYGIPGLSQDKWQKNLNIFLELGIPHLSAYALTVEHKTLLNHLIRKQKIAPLDEGLAAVHFQYLQKFLKTNNFWQYEVSNFARNSFFSRHNSSYWKQAKYLGFGPSAHSFDSSSRSWNIASNLKYIKSLQKNIRPFTAEILTLANQYNEYILTGLRTIWGVSPEYIKDNFGSVFYAYFNKKAARLLLDNKLRIVDKSSTWSIAGNVVVNPQYYFVVDGIITTFIYIN